MEIPIPGKMVFILTLFPTTLPHEDPWGRFIYKDTWLTTPPHLQTDPQYKVGMHLLPVAFRHANLSLAFGDVTAGYTLVGRAIQSILAASQAGYTIIIFHMASRPDHIRNGFIEENHVSSTKSIG